MDKIQQKRQKHNEANKKYRESHWEQIRIQMQKWYQKNKVNYYYKERRRKNSKKWREKLKKENPEKYRQRLKEWRNNNPEKNKEYQRKRREKMGIKKRIKGISGKEKIRILKELKGNKCQACGYNEELRILIFHHLRDKEFCIGSERGKSMERLKKEVEKCILLCPNCHALTHLQARLN